MPDRYRRRNTSLSRELVHLGLRRAPTQHRHEPTKDAIGIAERLDKAGADLVSLSERIDTTTAVGKMIFRLLAAFAEFERDLIRERVRAGMTVAKAEQASGKERLHKNGRVKKSIGRPRVTTDVERKVRELRAQEWGGNRIARELAIGSGTVRRIAEE